MKKIISITAVLLALISGASIYALTPEKINKPVSDVCPACQWNGIALHGKVQVVESFPDIKVQVVESFPDLKVQEVTSFPDNCGQWQFVESFPDFKIQFVESFPDLKIQYVNSFPGCP